MLSWLRAMAVWLSLPLTLYMLLLAGGILFSPPNTYSPYDIVNWLPLPYFFSLLVWYAHERARYINHNNRGRYDGGIDQHRPKGE